MEFALWKPEWLEIVERQEEILRVERMNAADALRLGLIMERTAREKFGRPAALRVIANGQVTFSYLMDGTDMNNCWWMDKKLNTCRISGVSSLRTLLEVAVGRRPMEPEFEMENNFALCGGCFPLRTGAGKLLGWALCSGLPHQCDHQLLASSLAEFLGAEIPEIAE